jgi:hypothetical protein
MNYLLTLRLRLEITYVRENSNKIWFSSHLLDKFLTFDKRKSLLLFSLNRNFRNFAPDLRKLKNNAGNICSRTGDARVTDS